MSTSSDGELLGMPTHYLLSQIASNVKSNAPTAMATIPPRATWTTALSAASRSLESTDQEMVVFPQRTKERQEALKKMILSERSLSSANIPLRSPSTSDELPIKTPFPKTLIPPRANPKMKERLRQLAKENMGFSNRQPYVLKTNAGITERVLPVVSGTLRLCGIDEETEDQSHECTLTQDDMLWDTGSHCCSVTADILPQSFRDYLAQDKHNPYRDASGTKVQVDGYVALTNSTFFFNTVFTVVSASAIPNGRSGVILGQSGFLNRMLWSSIPRALLEYRGEKVEDSEWGSIHLTEWIDHCGELHQF